AQRVGVRCESCTHAGLLPFARQPLLRAVAVPPGFAGPIPLRLPGDLFLGAVVTRTRAGHALSVFVNPAFAQGQSGLARDRRFVLYAPPGSELRAQPGSRAAELTYLRYRKVQAYLEHPATAREAASFGAPRFVFYFDGAVLRPDIRERFNAISFDTEMIVVNPSLPTTNQSTAPLRPHASTLHYHEPETIDFTFKIGNTKKQTLAEQTDASASPRSISRPPLSALSLHKSSQLVGESTPYQQIKTVRPRPDFVQAEKPSCANEFREHMGIYILIIVLAIIVLVLFILVIVLYSRLVNLTVRNLLVTNLTSIGTATRLDIPDPLQFTCPNGIQDANAVRYCEQIPPDSTIGLYAPTVRTGTFNSKQYNVTNLYYSNVFLLNFTQTSPLNVSELTAQHIMANDVSYSTELIQDGTAEFRTGQVSVQDFRNANFTNTTLGFSVTSLSALHVQGISSPSSVTPATTGAVTATQVLLAQRDSSTPVTTFSITGDVNVSSLVGGSTTTGQQALAWTFQNVSASRLVTTPIVTTVKTINGMDTPVTLDINLNNSLTTETLTFSQLGAQTSVQVSAEFTITNASVFNCTTHLLTIPSPTATPPNTGTGLYIKSLSDKGLPSLNALNVGSLRIDSGGICNAGEPATSTTRTCMLSSTGSSDIGSISATTVTSTGQLTSTFCQCT
ncbi:Chromosome segregation ATPase, partial [Giardia duodenalis]